MKSIRNNESGMVSITVTVVLMLVISITVLSFAQIIRREQRQALDSQLSSQAYYAAESGINDTRQYIKENYPGMVPPNKNRCDNSEGTYNLQTMNPASVSTMIDSDTTTGYTCILINGSPNSLKYALSTTAASKIIPVDAGTGNAINRIDLSWTPDDKNNPLGNCPTNATAATALPTGLPADDVSSLPKWRCGYGVVRIDLTPFPHSGTSRSATMADTFTAFLMPLNGVSSDISYVGANMNVNGGIANQGARATTSCNLDSCRITITNLGTDRYYIRASALYRDSVLSVSARNSAGNTLSLHGAQLVVDSTGRSQDVLRRIQVRIPLIGEDVFSDYGVQSTDSICKQFVTYPGTSYNSAPSCP